MGQGINKVILIGNVGTDPELRTMPNGNAATNISLATSEQWNDKTSGDKKEKTEWHRVVFFNRLAEVVEQYVQKGSKIYIEGKLQTRSWEQDGIKRYTTEIIAHQMQMLDNRSKDSKVYNEKPLPAPATAPGTKPSNMGDFDDDIPF